MSPRVASKAFMATLAIAIRKWWMSAYGTQGSSWFNARVKGATASRRGFL